MKIIRKIVISSTLIIGLNLCFCKGYFLKTVVENIDPLSERLQSRVAMWDLLSKLFQYEKFITLNIEDYRVKNKFSYDTFIKLLQTKVGLPVAVIKTDKDSKRTIDIYETYKYQQNANTSYIFVMDMRVDLISFDAARITSIAWNPRANFVIVTVIDSLSKIHRVFRKMWKTYGMDKIIAIDLKSDHIVAFNCFNDQIKVFNDSDIEEILQYRLPKHGFDRYPIKVVMYEKRPTAIRIPNSTKFQGMEQMLIDTLQHALNFSVEMCAISDFSDEDDGPIPIILEKLKNREIDIAANMYDIRGHASRPEIGYEYTTPFFTERIHFIVPKAEKIPLWLSMYLVFDIRTWMLSGCLFGLFIVLWLCILRFGLRRKIRGHIGSVTINVLFLMSGHAIPVQMRTYSKQLLSICASIFAIIMVNCFSGDLFRRFAEDAYYPDINSFKELEESGLRIYYGFWSAAALLNDSNHSSLIKLVEKSNVSSAFNLKNGLLDHAILSRTTRAKYETAKSFIENDGSILFHWIEEPLRVFSMAYIVPSDWSFLNTFNAHINKILEAGLIQKWYDDTFFNLTLWKEKITYASFETVPRAFTLSDLRLAWFVLGIGLSISFIVFLMELAWHSRTSKKRARRNLPLR